MKSAIDSEVGKKYGRLQVKCIVPSSERGNGSTARRVIALCDCGTERVFDFASMRAGRCRSCGCLKRERMRNGISVTHGLSKTAEYGNWRAMLSRCENPNVRSYATYGARGIKVCARWHTFENYFEDMGARPQGMSLDRIDNDGNYEPGNCRWATSYQQTRNMSSNVVIEHEGRSMCMADWALLTGLKKATIWARLKRGWDAGRALSALLPQVRS